MKYNNYIKSPMNYTGGKFNLLPQLIPLFPCPKTNDSKFIDLFCGGGNIISNIYGYKRIACDCISQIIELYKFFQSNPTNEVIRYIDSIIVKYDLNKDNADGYNKFRSYYNECKDKNPLDLFLLVCYSFNNQIRFNSSGEFNMPFGKCKSSFNSSIKKNLIKFSKSIKGVDFINQDFRQLNINDLKTGDYVYCDPPYFITCATYNEQDGWNEKDENDLLNLLETLDKKDIYFGLSNVLSNKGETNNILKEWIDRHDFKVYHLDYDYNNCNYHTKNKSEGFTDEVFITNYVNDNKQEISLF